MQMLMHVRFPIEPFNTAVREGTAGQKIQRIMEAVKPAAAYFNASGGRRAAGRHSGGQPRRPVRYSAAR